METYDGIKIYKSSRTSSEYVLRKKYTIWWCELIYCSIEQLLLHDPGKPC